MWRHILARVDSYRDVETPLINAIERLIDFVVDGSLDDEDDERRITAPQGH